ncbi:MAG: alpha/beta fold hydrolase BchO [Rhodopila sp.]
MSTGPVWERDGRDWPNRAASRFVTAVGLRWHVQIMGRGPVLLLLHGTGAATHSWRDLMPLLAERYTVVAPDLPGHGFTSAPATAAGYTLAGVAREVTELLHALKMSPSMIIGHSAGAAIGIRMALDGAVAPQAIISLNGALLPFPGVTNDFFGPAARFLASTPLAAWAVTLITGSKPSVDRLLQSTGSRIDAAGARYYGRLVGNPGHVRSALALMANWDLRTLVRDMAKLKPRLILLTGTRDGMVPPTEAYRVRAAVPAAEVVSLRGLGHLAHEERPEEIVRLVNRVAAEAQAT